MSAAPRARARPMARAVRLAVMGFLLAGVLLTVSIIHGEYSEARASPQNSPQIIQNGSVPTVMSRYGFAGQPHGLETACRSVRHGGRSISSATGRPAAELTSSTRAPADPL